MKKNAAQRSWKTRLHEIIYEADTPVGKLFDVILLILIVISIISVMLETVDGYHPDFYQALYIVEWIITIFFTIEYILRIWIVKKPRNYIFSFYGIIDLLSTIPLYLSLIFTGSSALLTIRALRLLRLFRIFKIARYVGEGAKLKHALKSSLPKISVFLFSVLVLTIIMGTIMYYVEGEETGFENIPLSIYWCIVTLTTVGFGDIAPVTPLGRFIASAIMIIGYGIIAVPTGIVSAEYGNKKEKKVTPVLNTQNCPHCSEPEHLDQAKYCHNCGNLLNE